MPSSSIGIGILGGTGYGAGELLRLLTQHPMVKVVTVSSRSAAGTLLSDTHPHLQGFYSLRYSDQLDLAALKDCTNKVVFSALPHGVSGTVIAQQYDTWQDKGIRCIDLSGDLRILNHDLHQTHYPNSPLLPEL